MPTVDLNADLGEGAGSDADLIPLISSASVACGGHAGDLESMAAVTDLAARHGVTVGAHPSYPDREGFGRRDTAIPTKDLAESLRQQVTGLSSLAPVRFVKAHGALYNRAATDPSLADLMVSVASEFGLVLLCPGGSEMARRAQVAGRPWRAEAFADRAYRADGSLTSRSDPGSVITDAAEVAERAVSLALSGRVRHVDGGWVHLPVDSICLHGDTPGAVNLARAVRRGLEEAGVEILPFA